MQQKNLLVFIVLCILILVGWGMLQNALWPPPQKKKVDETAAKKERPEEKPLPPLTAADMRRLAAALGAGGVANGLNPQNPALIAAQLGAGQEVAERVAQVVTPFLDFFTPASATARAIDLSGDNSYLQVKVTTLGAGVQRLTLPKFQAADEFGRPMFETLNGTRKKVLLDLIPDDPIRPSFLMFHYPNPAGDPDDPDPTKRSHPSPLLGERLWTVVTDESKEWKADKDGVQVNDRNERKITFSFNSIPGFEGIEIRKTYMLGPRDYHIGVSLEIRDKRPPPPRGEKLAPFRYQLAGAHGLPIEGEWYASVYRQPMLGLVTRNGGFWRDLDETQQRIAFRQGGERVPLTSGDSTIQYAGIANQYFTSLIVVDNEQASASAGGVKPQDVVEYARPTLESEEKRAQVIGLRIHKDRPQDSTVSVVTIPDKRILTLRLLPGALKNIDERGIKERDAVLVNFYESYKGELVATGIRPGREPRPHLEDITVRVVSNALFTEARPTDKVVHKFMLYNGPVKVSLLGQFTGEKAVSPELVDRYWDTLNLRTLTDYHSPGWLGEFANFIRWTDLIILFTRLMHWLLDKLHFILPNYGLAIILLTLIVRGLMFPISRRQATLGIKMQELGPEVKKVQEKYKNDPQARNKAVMELYRKHGVNPLGGCLTLLLQLPVFMGLYYALQESIHFRLAGFLWMDNLAAPDMLLWWGESIPIISDPDHMGGLGYLGPYLNVLPIFAVALMLVQQKMMTPPPADEQQAMQQKMFKWMMILFGFLFYKLPAGLCLYFIVSSLWGVLERRYMPKRPVPGAAGGGPGKGGGGGGGGGGPGKGGGGGGRGKGRQGKKEKEPDGAITKVRNWWQEVLKQAKKK
jgi:YidC/Oxa1 family membrane protein insertase